MTATGSKRREGEKPREGSAADGVKGEPLVPPAVDVGGTEASGVVGVLSDTGPRAGVVEPGTVPAEGLGGEAAAAGEADGVKAAGPGAGTGAPAEALH